MGSEPYETIFRRLQQGPISQNPTHMQYISGPDPLPEGLAPVIFIGFPFPPPHSAQLLAWINWLRNSCNNL